MLLKLKAKIGSEIKTVLVARSAIVTVIPFGDHTHLYLKNIAAPIEVQTPFEQLQSFLSSAFDQGVLEHERK